MKDNKSKISKMKDLSLLSLLLALLGVVVVSIIVAIYRLSQPLKDLTEKYDGYVCKDANLYFSKGTNQSSVGQIKNFRLANGITPLVRCWNIPGRFSDGFIGLSMTIGAPVGPLSSTEVYVFQRPDNDVNPLTDWSVKSISVVAGDKTAVIPCEDAVLKEIREYSVERISASELPPELKFVAREKLSIRLDFKENGNIFWESEIEISNTGELFFKMRTNPKSDAEQEVYSLIPEQSRLYTAIKGSM